MELVLTDDQEFFRDTTRKFLGSECPIPKVRELRANDAGFEPDYWRQGAELGWMSLLVPEELGGGSVSGNGPADLALVADAFGAHVAPGPLLPCNVVAAALARSGNERAADRAAPGPGRRRAVATWASTELPPHDRLGDIGLRAEADGDGYVLTGVKSPVEAGPRPTSCSSPRPPTPGSPSSSCPPTPRRHGHAAAQRRPRPALRPHPVRRRAVPAARWSARPGAAAADVERQLQIAGVVQSAEMVGAADAVFDITLDWAFSRYSFGRPLASYQEIKHRFADMKMWLEASHALADSAARHVSTRRRRRRRSRSARPRRTPAVPGRARAGLRADARWHRRHLRARHPPVPPPHHGRPLTYGTPPTTTAASVRCASRTPA